MTNEDAIVIIENERPHCGKRITFTEEEKCEAFDMAIEALKQTDFADFILHWLADSYGCICNYDFAGINASVYLYEHDNDYCEEGCGKNTDYDCWKKFLELKYQEHKKEGDGE